MENRNSQEETIVRYDLPIPFGWYCAMHTNELLKEEVTNIRLFDKDWVCFRTESGEICICEPYCPHMGAHLGVGGKIDGEWLRCPFHNWAFDSNGFCRDVPYAKAIPSRARDQPVLRILPSVEINGMIWVWYHPRNIEPLWDLSEISRLNIDHWESDTDYVYDIQTVAQEIGENSVDTPHLKYVHGQQSTIQSSSHYQGHVRRTDISMPLTVQDPQGKELECIYTLFFSQVGPGIQVTEMQRIAKVTNIITITPIDRELTRLRFNFFFPKHENALNREMVGNIIREQVGNHGELVGIDGDIPIWNNKIYREKPLLCDGDGRIFEYRRWFSQFYDK